MLKIVEFSLIALYIAAKSSLSCEEFLSYKSFQLYLTSQTSVANIWSSLSETLITLLYHNILASPIIDALWICRIEEFNDDPTNKTLVRLLCTFGFLLDSLVSSRCMYTAGNILHCWKYFTLTAHKTSHVWRSCVNYF